MLGLGRQTSKRLACRNLRLRQRRPGETPIVRFSVPFPGITYVRSATRQERPRARFSLDARHHLAACPSLFLCRGPRRGPPPARRGDRDRARHHRHQCSDQPVEQRVLRCDSAVRLGRLYLAIGIFHDAGCQLCHSKNLSAISPAMAPDPLARMDDGSVSGALDRQCESLPHAAPGRRRRQSGSARSGGYQEIYRSHHGHLHRRAQLRGLVLFVRARSSGACRARRPSSCSG